MTELDRYRDKIDRTDTELLDMLARRFSYSQRIGEIKREKGMPVVQSDRFDEILTSRKRQAIEAGLSEKFTEDFLRLIHTESVRIQKEMGEKGE